MWESKGHVWGQVGKHEGGGGGWRGMRRPARLPPTPAHTACQGSPGQPSRQCRHGGVWSVPTDLFFWAKRGVHFLLIIHLAGRMVAGIQNLNHMGSWEVGILMSHERNKMSLWLGGRKSGEGQVKPQVCWESILGHSHTAPKVPNNLLPRESWEIHGESAQAAAWEMVGRKKRRQGSETAPELMHGGGAGGSR